MTNIENINDPWLIIPLAILGLGILIWGTWEFFISPSLPKKAKKEVTQVYLGVGIYTFTGTATKHPSGTLIKGTMYVKDQDQREPWDIHFWIPADVSLKEISLEYHSGSLYKGFCLRNGRKMYLANTERVVSHNM